jgi:chromosome segregation ATPase
MTDIVERLRSRACPYCGPDDIEAAEDNERMEAEIERLRRDIESLCDVGDENCVVIDKQKAEIERLRERCEGYKGQVKWGADEIERLQVDKNEGDRLLVVALQLRDDARQELKQEKAEIKRLQTENKDLRRQLGSAESALGVRR